MILSRATSTSRKKSRLALTLLLLLLSLSCLEAGEYRIGIVKPEDASSRVLRLEEILSFASARVLEPGLVEKARARDLLLEKVEEGKKRAELIRSEKDLEEEENDEEMPVYYDGLLVPLVLTEKEQEFLSSGDEAAIRYLEYHNDLDEILLIDEAYETGFSELELLFSDGSSYFFLLDEETEEFEGIILSSLVERYRGSQFSLVRLMGDQSAEFYEDGKSIERYGSYLLLENTYHLVEVVRKGYRSLMLDCDPRTTSTLEYDLEKLEGRPAYITSIPYPDTLLYSGRSLEEMYIPSLESPYSLSLSKEGYLSRIVQGTDDDGMIRVELLPLSLYDPDLVERNKGRFYAHLVATLVSFGLSVASDSIYNLTGEEWLRPTSIALKGLSVTNIILLVDSLLDYKNAVYRSY